MVDHALHGQRRSERRRLSRLWPEMVARLLHGFCNRRALGGDRRRPVTWMRWWRPR